MSNDFIRKGRMEEVIGRLAAQFILEQSNKNSLITVIKSEVTKDFSRAKIAISVIPDDKQQEALSFLKRRRSDFREYINNNSKLPKTPFVDFIVESPKNDSL